MIFAHKWRLWGPVVLSLSLIQVWVTGEAGSAGRRRHFSPQPTEFLVNPRSAERHTFCLGILLDSHAWNTSPGRCPWGVLARCLNRHNWLLWMNLFYSELFSYLKLSHEKETHLVFAISSFCSLSKVHDHRWELEHRLTGTQSLALIACYLCSMTICNLL